jgi:hypothetical protein
VLKLSRKSLTLKCPRHVYQQYVGEVKSRPNCTTCDAIRDVVAASDALDRAARKAENAIARTSLPGAAE